MEQEISSQYFRPGSVDEDPNNEVYIKVGVVQGTPPTSVRRQMNVNRYLQNVASIRPAQTPVIIYNLKFLHIIKFKNKIQSKLLNGKSKCQTYRNVPLEMIRKKYILKD